MRWRVASHELKPEGDLFMTKRLVLAACGLAATSLQGREMIVPVVTGIVGARVFSTTVQVKNASSTARVSSRIGGLTASVEC